MSSLPDAPVLVALALAAVVLGAMVVASSKMLKWVIVLMLFAASTALAVNDYGLVVNQTWLMPLQTNRSIVFILLGAALTGGVFLHLKALTHARFGIQTQFLLVIGLFAAAIRAKHYGLGDAIETAVLVLLTVPAISVAISGSIREWKDFHTVLRIFPVFGMVYLGALALQFSINPRVLVFGAESRFVGFLGNPQHAATLFGPLIGLVIFSIINEPVKILRLLWIGVLGASLICLVWTQSRTGLLMAVLCTAGVFYHRIGSAILTLPILGLIAIGALQVGSALGIDLTTDRLVSTQDTRSAAFMEMWTSAMQSPIYGRPFDEIDGSENSLLIGFAHYGFGMLIILLAFMVASGFMMLRVFRLRRTLPKRYRPVADVILGFNAAYFAGGMLEGYIVARIAFTLVLIQVFAALTSRLIALARADEASGAFDAIRSADEDEMFGPVGASGGPGWVTTEQLAYTSSYSSEHKD